MSLESIDQSYLLYWSHHTRDYALPPGSACDLHPARQALSQIDYSPMRVWLVHSASQAMADPFSEPDLTWHF